MIGQAGANSVIRGSVIEVPYKGCTKETPGMEKTIVKCVRKCVVKRFDPLVKVQTVKQSVTKLVQSPIVNKDQSVKKGAMSQIGLFRQVQVRKEVQSLNLGVPTLRELSRKQGGGGTERIPSQLGKVYKGPSGTVLCLRSEIRILENTISKQSTNKPKVQSNRKGKHRHRGRKDAPKRGNRANKYFYRSVHRSPVLKREEKRGLQTSF